MKNKTKKIITFVVILLGMLMIASNVFATAVDMSPNKVTGTQSNLSNSVDSIMGNVLGVVQVVAIAIAVIMLIVLAIKYISAAPSEKADIKKGMATYVIGAVLLFGASAILEIIKNFASTIK